MVWETCFHDWSTLRAVGSASDVPQAISMLQNATTAEEARKAYWQIDNTVVVQGALYEAALPTASSLVCLLPQCSRVSRARVLELLVQLGAGEPDSSELLAGNKNLPELCARELSRGIGIYFSLLETGTDEERGLCVDLLGFCARYDASLHERVRWYLKRLLTEEISSGLAALIRDWLSEFVDTNKQ